MSLLTSNCVLTNIKLQTNWNTSIESCKIVTWLFNNLNNSFFQVVEANLFSISSTRRGNWQIRSWKDTRAERKYTHNHLNVCKMPWGSLHFFFQAEKWCAQSQSLTFDVNANGIISLLLFTFRVESNWAPRRFKSNISRYAGIELSAPTKGARNSKYKQ